MNNLVCVEAASRLVGQAYTINQKLEYSVSTMAEECTVSY